MKKSDKTLTWSSLLFTLLIPFHPVILYVCHAIYFFVWSFDFSHKDIVYHAQLLKINNNKCLRYVIARKLRILVKHSATKVEAHIGKRESLRLPQPIKIKSVWNSKSWTTFYMHQEKRKAQAL